MNKLIGRRVVVTTNNYGVASYQGMVGTIAAVSSFSVQVTFYGHDRRPIFGPDEVRYLNNKPVVLS